MKKKTWLRAIHQWFHWNDYPIPTIQIGMVHHFDGWMWHEINAAARRNEMWIKENMGHLTRTMEFLGL